VKLPVFGSVGYYRVSMNFMQYWINLFCFMAIIF